MVVVFEHPSTERGQRLLLGYRIDRSQLQPGDHIYCYRKKNLYSHHGIYMGEDQSVIHVMGKEKKIKGPCPKCNYYENRHSGVVKTCLDCFQSDDPFSSTLYLYQYGLSFQDCEWYRPGTCINIISLPLNWVVSQAFAFLMGEEDFGKYDLFKNNCEIFAILCKTGLRCRTQVTYALHRGLVLLD